MAAGTADGRIDRETGIKIELTTQFNLRAGEGVFLEADRVDLGRPLREAQWEHRLQDHSLLRIGEPLIDLCQCDQSGAGHAGRQCRVAEHDAFAWRGGLHGGCRGSDDWLCCGRGSHSLFGLGLVQCGLLLCRGHRLCCWCLPCYRHRLGHRLRGVDRLPSFRDRLIGGGRRRVHELLCLQGLLVDGGSLGGLVPLVGRGIEGFDRLDFDDLTLGAGPTRRRTAHEPDHVRGDHQNGCGRDEAEGKARGHGESSCWNDEAISLKICGSKTDSGHGISHS